MNKLPEEIESIIFSFIPIKTLALCNKNYWTENYNAQRSITNIAYSRFLLRNDCYFIFEYYLRKNISLFKKKKDAISCQSHLH